MYNCLEFRTFITGSCVGRSSTVLTWVTGNRGPHQCPLQWCPHTWHLEHSLRRGRIRKAFTLRYAYWFLCRVVSHAQAQPHQHRRREAAGPRRAICALGRSLGRLWGPRRRTSVQYTLLIFPRGWDASVACASRLGPADTCLTKHNCQEILGHHK